MSAAVARTAWPRVLAWALALPLLDLNAVDMQRLPRNILDAKIANQYQLIALGKRGNRVFIGAADVQKSAAFYDAALGALGIKNLGPFGNGWVLFGREKPAFIIFGIFFALLLHNTAFGRRTLAIGQSPEAARFAGINVVRHKIIVFTFTGFMSGVAGVIYTFRFSTAQADNGVGLELLVISAILLGGVSIFGGIGTMWGVVAGVLLAGSVESWLTLQEINAQWRTIVTGILLLISVAAPVLVQKGKARRELKALKS